MNIRKLLCDVLLYLQKTTKFFCETPQFFVNLQHSTAQLITILFFLSHFSFSQVYISSGTDFHISHISDTFYSEFSSVSLSSDISGTGVFYLSHVDSLWTNNSPFVSRFVVSHSKVYILGDIISCGVLKLDNSYLYFPSGGIEDLYEFMDSIVLDSMSNIYMMRNLSYEKLVINKFYSIKYPSLFFYCDNSICFIKGMENKVILVGEITLYSSVSLHIPTPPP
ncbi:MAG: hypothetical protein ACPGSD_17625 [Flavobacteriales bacterium]